LTSIGLDEPWTTLDDGTTRVPEIEYSRGLAGRLWTTLRRLRKRAVDERIK
jgi:hypothetical protein